MNSTPDLRVKLGFLELKNPVMTASGTFGYGSEFESFVNPDLLGGIVVKGLSLKPIAGNSTPRIVETPAGMLNAIGLANIGVDEFLEKKLPWLKTLNTNVVVNIYGHSVDEYEGLAKAFKGVEGITALEVNISCPNVARGGMIFGKDPAASAMITERIVKNTDKPVIVKLTPNVTDICILARAIEDSGASIISLINTLSGMAVDIERRRPKLANISGGLSGPAIKPVALYLVRQVVKTVKIPVIGIGGIMDYKDALEFLIVGAKAIQVGTANFVNPRATLEIIEGLRSYCTEKGICDINEIIGSLDVEACSRI
jgi:dihydroorotate dehydrogenase (NAD+) catalytic subunit